MKKSKVVSVTAVVVLSLVALVAAYLLIASIMNRPAEAPESTSKTVVQYEPNRLDDAGVSTRLLELHEENEDVVALISIEGTTLEYPVMSSTPEDYYFRRGVDKKYNTSGLPFLANDCELNAPGGNMIIYGHNMERETNLEPVFAALSKYRTLDFTQENPIITFDTLDGRHEYVVISVVLTDVANDGFYYWDMKDVSGKANDEFLYAVRRRSIVNTTLPAGPDDAYMTLSTCAQDGGANGRLVILARELREGEKDATLGMKYTHNERVVLPRIFEGKIEFEPVKE